MALVSKTFSEIITFTRASTGSYFDSAGTLQSAAINSPRLDYNPSTLAAQGLLIEEQRTNSIRNNTMVGAVAGTPGTLPTNWITLGAGIGTLTQQIVGTGASNGIAYIDIRISGTTSTISFGISFESNTQISAASGQNWTSSIYLARIGGSTSNLTVSQRVLERNIAGGGVANTTTNITSGLGTSLSRFFVTRTLTDATTAFVTTDALLEFSSGVAIDITLRIGLPQLEQGAFATSVIPTTTAAVTRSADVASVNTMSPWYNATEGTLYAEVGYQQNNPTAAQMAASFNSTANNRWTAAFTQTSGQGIMLRNTSGAGLLQTSTANAAIVGATNKIALAISTGASIVLNGGTAATNASYAAPTVTQLQLGNQLAGGYLNGYLRRITYYPRRLTDAELQIITA